MFSLYQPYYVELIEKNKRLRNTLEEASECQQNLVNNLEGHWKGQTAQWFTETYDEFFQERTDLREYFWKMESKFGGKLMKGVDKKFPINIIGIMLLATGCAMTGSITEELDSKEFSDLTIESEVQDTTETDIICKYEIISETLLGNEVYGRILNDSNINILLPIFYSQNGNEQISKKINESLLTACIGDDEELIYGDYSGEIQEYGYNLEYNVASSEADWFSIVYSGQFYSMNYNYEFERGITIDVNTGEKKSINDYIGINDELLEEFKNGNLRYTTQSLDDKDDLSDFLDEFIKSYKDDDIDIYQCFYIEDGEVHLIIPMDYGINSYFEIIGAKVK